MVTAVERVRERLKRATGALEANNIPYAVIGGHAIAAWVATVDRGAARNTPDVDLLVREQDVDASARVFENAGFIRASTTGMITFIDGREGSAREGIHIFLARHRYGLAMAPDVTEVAPTNEGFRLLALEPLVRMKLSSLRSKDAMHLRDLLDVGLIDASWTSRFPPELAARLQHLIDTPED